jgi:hypothetical protein
LRFFDYLGKQNDEQLELPLGTRQAQTVQDGWQGSPSLIVGQLPKGLLQGKPISIEQGKQMGPPD